MNVDKRIFRLAGSFTLIGLALGYWVSPWGYLLSVFVGINLIQFSFTGFCPASLVLERIDKMLGKS